MAHDDDMPDGRTGGGVHRRLPEHCGRVALVLQGGGALGAYQAGAFEALHEAGYDPDWVTGISIGAINAAIIAGNPRELRVPRLRQFWDLVSSQIAAPAIHEGMFRLGYNQLSAGAAMLTGIPGFFRPRIFWPWLAAPGTLAATSWYDTSPLRETLSELVDFELVNDGPVRLSVTAVDVESGNSAPFDSARQRITVDHVMASGALPPGFPAIEIEGRRYWDGGIVSNTPLNDVLDDEPHRSTLIFQVDLFNQKGRLPENLDDVLERQKDIQFSSRTRYNTQRFADVQKMRRAIAAFLEQVPDEIRDAPQLSGLWPHACSETMTIVHLIYRHRVDELESKDYEFSRASMLEHWQSGQEDARKAIRHQEAWLAPPSRDEGLRIFDFTRREQP